MRLRRILLGFGLLCFGVIFCGNQQDAFAIDWSGVKICVDGSAKTTNYNGAVWNPTFREYGVWAWSFPVHATGGICNSGVCSVQGGGRAIWAYPGSDYEWTPSKWHKTEQTIGASFDCIGGDHNDTPQGCYTPTSIKDKGGGLYSMKINESGRSGQTLGGEIRIASRTLTGVAVDTGGNGIGLDNRTSSVVYGSSASISAYSAPEGYTFIGWRSNRYSGGVSGGGTYSVGSLTSNVTIYAVYQRDSFTGQARVYSDNSSSSTGYVNADRTADTLNVDCANSGCDVTYYLDLKRDSGSGPTNYVFYRGGSAIAGHAWVSVTPSTGGQNFYARTETLRPGSSLCYQNSFKPYGGLGNGDYRTATACASAKVTSFKGKSTVSGATSGNTGWVDSNTTKTFFVNNCSSTSGCRVSFKHELMRENSAGSTTYSFVRTSNLTDTGKRVSAWTSGVDTFNSSSGTVRNSEEFTLYPGMVVCESLVFKQNNNTVNAAGNVSSTVCASALGNAQPDNPPNSDASEDPNADSGDTSFINIKVRNKSVAKYDNYQRMVYAKPSDKLDYRATYNPNVQYTYYLKPQQMRIDGGTVYNGGGNTLGSLFNSYKGSLQSWNNGFSVQFAYDSNFSGVLKNITHSAGDFSKKSDVNSYNAATGVLASEVGKSLDERAITNLNNTVSTTPSQVSFTNNGGNNLGNVITTSQNKIAMAKVPYNFNTDISVTTPDTTPVYSGETTTIGFDVTIKPKHNNETMNEDDLDYATIVGDPKYKLIVYRGGEQGGTIYNNDDLCGYYGLANNEVDCGYSEETDGGDTFKNGIGLHSETTRKLTRTFNAQDTSAGSKICVAAAFFPASSGSDTNMDPKGDNSWRISDSKCYTIAKKPSLQIWGGNFFSNSNISAAVAVKNNVAGLAEHTYSVSKPNAYSYVFGAWGELGLVSSGAIKGVASGTYTGYTANNNGTLIATPGGSKEEHTKVNFCKRGVMTFANEPCNGSSLGNLGNTTSTANASEDKSAIVSNFTSIKRDGEGNDMNRVSGEVVLNDEAKKNDRGIYYYHNESENLTIPVSTINPGALQMVTSGKSIMITGDIVYGTPDAGYTNIDQMPKLVLYARDNVYINCNVKRIDAIIIAENTVITCGDFSTDLETSSIKTNINKRENSNQLTINGTVISDRLIANRTYGAATGNNSIISGEIINYDSTNYVWQNWKSDGGAGAQMKVTYTKELSPRY